MHIEMVFKIIVIIGYGSNVIGTRQQPRRLAISKGNNYNTIK